MRSVSATLATAQSSSSRKPYFRLAFSNYDLTDLVDLSSDSSAYGNRILLIDYVEESYNEYATIFLRNTNRDIPSMLGYWTAIGLGDVTPAGNEYASYPYLWVKHQQTVSIAGNLYEVLELEGMWAKLNETLLRMGSPPNYLQFTSKDEIGGNKTPYDIIKYIIENEIDPAFTMEPLVENDGIIDTYEPDFSINENQKFESAGSVIYTLIKMTWSFLRARVELGMEVKYPQETDPVDITYYSYQEPKFIQYTDRKNLIIPNRVYVFANAGEDGMWTDLITAIADDTPSQDAYGIVPDIALAPEVTKQEDADNRALAIMNRHRAENLSGKMIIPHDCRLELYDRVSVEDKRGY